MSLFRDKLSPVLWLIESAYRALGGNMKSRNSRPYWLLIGFVISLFFHVVAVAEDCELGSDNESRVETARQLLTLNASNYQDRIEYWAEDVIYKDPIFTNNGRDEMQVYLDAMFSDALYGIPPSREVSITDELATTSEDGAMIYMATVKSTTGADDSLNVQSGMSIIKFRADEGCPSYHRDYYSEGDHWWTIPKFHTTTKGFREVYIGLFGLTGRCFDEDGDGYSKYHLARGCPNKGVDCNDYAATINPGVEEILGNGIDDDCNSKTID